MRFKKLIAAGGAFLLVLGASTLGAAAAYADDGTTSGDTVVTDTTTATDPAAETPPAPEPVVETPPASDPVVETPPASDPEPVVETTDPVESNTPSSESDSDPPADSGSSSVISPIKRIASFTRTTATLKSGFAADKPPVDNTNEVTYWENLYPGTTCYKDDTTYGSVTGDGLGVVLLPGTYAVLIVKSGAEDNGDGPGNAVFENPTPGTTYYGPLNNGGQQGAVSHWIVCITDGEVGSEVTPAAEGSPQTCDAEEEELVGGSIQLTLITGVTYTITGPNPDTTEIIPNGSGLATGLAPGDYNVSFELDSGLTTEVDSPIVITITPFDGDCVSDPCDIAIAPSSLNTDVADECCDTTAPVSLNTDTAPTCPLPDVWLCHATNANENANNPFNGLTLPWQGAVGHAFPNPNDDHTGDIIPPFDYYENGVLKHFDGQNWDPSIDPDSQAWHDFVTAGCVELEDVDPGATPSPQTCPEGLPVGGTITVTPITGVTYSLVGPLGNPGGPYGAPDGNNQWTGLAPGDYQVTYVLGSGQKSDVTNPIPATVGAFEGDCGLVEHPIVLPTAVAGSLSCLGISSYTLSNDLDDPNAVKWTVNGSPLGVPLATPSSFTVSSPGVFNIHAEANGPDYGLKDGAQQDWTFTFERPDDCDLDTLALTGQSPIVFLGGAMALILGGLALFRIRSMRRERPGSFI
ncbi:MAG TPA: hypothetical protein VF479_01140 [Pseudolysinimonas sp.]